MLEISIVFVFALAVVVFTLETWPAPYVPMVVGVSGLVVFAAYRFFGQVWEGRPARERPVPGEGPRGEPPDEQEQVRRKTEAIAGIDLDRVDGHLLDETADEDEETGESGQSKRSDFLDFEEAAETGLVSTPDPETDTGERE